MAAYATGCPSCGHPDLAPRSILVGQKAHRKTTDREYQEIVTLKCQNCGWLGEQSSGSTPAAQ